MILMDNASNLNQILTDAEKDLVNEITEKLKRNEITPEASKALAREFLSQLPPKSLPALIDVLRNLSTKYKEVRQVYAKYYGILEDMNDAQKVHAMATHINEGNIEKAIDVAKGGPSA